MDLRRKLVDLKLLYVILLSIVAALLRLLSSKLNIIVDYYTIPK